MTDLLVAVGLVLVIEGASYALFPDGMKRMAAMVEALPSPVLRRTGIITALVGFVIVWILRT